MQTDEINLRIHKISFTGDLSSWSTSMATDMSWMFFDAWAFDGDLSNFDVSSVEDMSNMFYNAYR